MRRLSQFPRLIYSPYALGLKSGPIKLAAPVTFTRV